ncbi:Golgi integral membrane protein 4 [Orussus abietinus]|uniref:Golgi integral membrane protein 4 n=1 Tax=Orussus abietinus TaxID=222816 RepID=UPI000625F213|nr:Golgi integral membrane protein 4 [Orussus abietinus]XP_012288381.1 Golgi integral membrane protein 4 [Orussus abietinus]XP_012288382.1 Golgi integral membrane protein 4 [Orussus abietinus]
MSGSRLGRGRGGRLAVYGGCGVVVVLLVFLYRAATSEMARLRELHVECAHQQEALAAQLQVIFEYKVRLEKSLAEEKSSNAAVKQELQQRASREKTLRDKDSIEAMQRFNSLQQTYKILQSEHQDLQDECNKRQKQALENANLLESTLQDLRSQIRKAKEDENKSMEHLKNKYLELETEKAGLENKYNELLKNSEGTDGTLQHLHKEVFQLKRELEEAKNSCKTPSPGPNGVSPQAPQQDHGEQPGSLGGPPQGLSPAQQQSTPNSELRAMASSKTKSSTKTIVNSITVASEKANNLRPISKVKLPNGVAPIPKIIDLKNENEERQREEPPKKEDAAQNSKNVYAENHFLDTDNKDKNKPEDNDHIDAPPAPAAGKHVGEQILERNENGHWFRVRPGVQEVGEEPNNLGRLQGFDEARQDGADDQYEGDYYKEPQPKNNDLHIIEGEDEGEDEDDQLDYPNNNLKPEKRD